MGALIPILIEGLGGVLANVARAKNNPKLATFVEGTQSAANETISAVKAYLAANPSGITPAEFDMRIRATVEALLKAGDEAEARIARRHAEQQ